MPTTSRKRSPTYCASSLVPNLPLFRSGSFPTCLCFQTRIVGRVLPRVHESSYNRRAVIPRLRVGPVRHRSCCGPSHMPRPNRTRRQYRVNAMPYRNIARRFHPSSWHAPRLLYHRICANFGHQTPKPPPGDTDGTPCGPCGSHRIASTICECATDTINGRQAWHNHQPLAPWEASGERLRHCRERCLCKRAQRQSRARR